jgi:hypothetical protein
MPQMASLCLIRLWKSSRITAEQELPDSLPKIRSIILNSIHYFEGDVPNSHDFSKPWQKISDLTSTVIAPNSELTLQGDTISADDVLRVVNRIVGTR